MARGEVDLYLHWDYQTLRYRDLVNEINPDANLECHIMQDGPIQSGYCLLINKYAPHPHAAALAVEYLLSDEGQIDRARGYARPIREDVEIPAELQETMIDNSEYEETIPLTDNEAVSEICTEIATRWEEEVIPLIG